MRMPTSTATSTGEKNSAKGDKDSEEEHVVLELDECSPECAAESEQAESNPCEVAQVETATDELPRISAATEHPGSVDEREDCSNCGRLPNELRMLRNQVKSLQG